MHDKVWIALFSQTGSEICNISEQLGRWPDVVITDNTTDTVDKRLTSGDTKLYASSYRSLNSVSKLSYYRDWFKPNYIITLHGWLNIVPPEICEEYNIYNGHPGLITVYPELKGYNPQEKVIKNIDRYRLIGSVIHKVTPEVDAGEIVCEMSKPNTYSTSDEIYNNLKKISLDSWLYFFNNIK